ncbi:IS66 family insertion sequence element accessory protein TnpB [uncultured Phascolarctobacterium sp.]|jgi:transposase|uniref:IS66 family insertion sequence element accessory protein TnpB n=1 Tax=uncultured Phascolarctobacterium sp. TaxID=512296 RepID=UPI0034498449
MLKDLQLDHVYIACGYTDLRLGIDCLSNLVQLHFELDPYTNTLFLFCGRRYDRIKALYWEGDGFFSSTNDWKKENFNDHATVLI